MHEGNSHYAGSACCRLCDSRSSECQDGCEGSRAPYAYTSEVYPGSASASGQAPGVSHSNGQRTGQEALELADVLAQGVYHELTAAVAETNTEIMMGAYDLKQAFRHIPGIDRLTIFHRGNGNQVIHVGDRTVEVGPMASTEEIGRALELQNPFCEESRMSAIDRIKAKALKARGIAPNAIKQFESDLDSLIAEESVIDQKRVAAVTPHQEAIAGVKGELDGLKSAIDILSNGEPT